MEKRFAWPLLLKAVSALLSILSAVIGGLYWGFSLQAMAMVSQRLLPEPFNPSIVLGLMLPFYVAVLSLLLTTFLKGKVFSSCVYAFTIAETLLILAFFIVHVFQYQGQTSHFKIFYETFALLLAGVIALSSVMVLLRLKAKKFRFRLHFVFFVFEALLWCLLIVLTHLYVSSIAMLLFGAALLLRSSSYIALIPENASSEEETSY